MAVISFDFDGILSRTDVQEFAKELKSRGHRILIITNRHGNKSNSDLYRIADEIGIKRHHIYFCEMLGKHRFISPGMQIMVHADDDWIDCELVSEECGVPTVKMFGNPNWKEEILNHIK